MIKLKGVTFRGLQKLSVTERLKTVKSSALGTTIISALTPSQFADLFPLYYRRQLPDISGFLKALPTSVSQKRAAYYDQQIQNTVKGSAAGTGMKKFDAAANYDMNNKTARVLKRGEVPLPQLSPDQLATYNAIKSGQMDANDPKAAFLKGLNEDQLKAAGLQKIKDEGGKEIFKYSPPTVSDEQAKADLSKSQSMSQSQKDVYDAAREAGLSDKGAKIAVANVMGEALHDPSSNHWDRTHMSQGIVQWEPPRAERIRQKFGAYPKDMSVKDQAKAYMWEMKNYYKGSWNSLSNDNLSDQERMWSVVRYYENPLDPTGDTSKRMSKLNKLATMPDTITKDYSKEAVEARKQQMVRQIETNQVTSLAQFTTSQQKDIINESGGSIAGPGQPINKNTTHMVDKNGFIQPVDSSLYAQRNSQQCATLSKAFNPQVGAASTWKVGGSGGIGPGVMVATQRYNDGSGGSVHAGYHTGIALSKPDSEGNFLMLEQFNGQPARVKKTNVNHYGQGNSYGVVAGGEKPSLSALSVGASLASGSDKDIIAQNMTTLAGSNAKTAETNPTEMKKVLPPAVDPAETVVRVQQVGKPDYMVTSPGAVPEQTQKGPIENAPEASTIKPAENLAEQPTAKPVKEEPKITPQRFNFNKQDYLNEIAKKHPMIDSPFASMAGQDRAYAWKETVKGLRDAEAKGVIKYNEKTGELVVNDMSHPEVQKILKDMQDNQLDRNTFMKKIEEQKVEAKKVEPPKEPPKPVQKVPEAPKPLSSATTATPTQTQHAPETKPETVAPAIKIAPTTPAPAVPTKATGGTTEAAPQISAYPIGGLRGDNSVVVDANQKPLFTMNTKTEAVLPTGASNQVNIVPSQKGPEGGVAQAPDPTKGMRDDIHQLKEQIGRSNEMVSGQQNASGMKPKSIVADRDPQMINQLLDQIGKPYRNPTAQRAFSRARFVETGDATNDFHHSIGNSTQSS